MAGPMRPPSPPAASRPPIVRLRSASLSPSVGRHGFLVTGSGAPPADAEGAVVAAAPSSATSAAAARIRVRVARDAAGGLGGRIGPAMVAALPLLLRRSVPPGAGGATTRRHRPHATRRSASAQRQDYPSAPASSLLRKDRAFERIASGPGGAASVNLAVG